MSPPRRRQGGDDQLEGLYDLDLIAAVIESGRKRKGLSVKEAAALCGIMRTVWYKKRDRDGSSFTLEDISVIAKAFGAPRGWPLLSWDDAQGWERWKRRG